MALRWNELDDGGDDLPPTPACGTLESPRTSGRWAATTTSSARNRLPGSDFWEVSGTDETDFTQDDGDASDAGPVPQSLFSRHGIEIAEGIEAGHEAGESVPGSPFAGDEPQRRQRSSVAKRGFENRQRSSVPSEDANTRRRRSMSSNADGRDDLVEGVWGLSWGRKRMWASALQSPLGQRLKALGQRARGSIFAPGSNDVPSRAHLVESAKARREGHGSKVSASIEKDVLGQVDANRDSDADGDVSESEARRFSTPCEFGSEVGLRPRRSMSERVRHVAVRAKELAATMGERWQRKRRSKLQRPPPPPIRSPMILLPGGFIRRAWDCIGLFLLLVLILVQLANERWISQHEGWMFYDMVDDPPYKAAMLKLQVLQDVFFIVDIFVNFRTAYCDEKTGEYVKDAWRIAAHYSRHWLVCDIFCAIPLDLILDETPAAAMETQRKKGKNWLKRVLRRTGVLHLLRQAAGTRPFNGARRVGKLMVHGRRMMRALGGVSQTVRGVQTLRHVLSLQSILAGWALLRNSGVLGIFSNASLAARTLAGSFAFLRLLLSSTVRGWAEGLNAIRSLLSSVVSFLRGKASPAATVKAEEEGGASGRGVEHKYQARGRNPLASSFAYLMRWASKCTRGVEGQGGEPVEEEEEGYLRTASPWRRERQLKSLFKGQTPTAARACRDQEQDEHEDGEPSLRSVRARRCDRAVALGASLSECAGNGAAAAGGSFRAGGSSRHSHATSEHSGHETELGNDFFDSDGDDGRVPDGDGDRCLPPLRAPGPWAPGQDEDGEAGVSMSCARYDVGLVAAGSARLAGAQPGPLSRSVAAQGCEMSHSATPSRQGLLVC